MTKRQVELLKGSIEKWVKIKQSVKAAEKGPYDCTLCDEYHKKGCNNCPIEKHTGRTFCDDTPYIAWGSHQRKTHGKGIPRYRAAGCNECSKLASNMLGFLVGLFYP